MPCMERDDPRGGEPPAKPPAEPFGEFAGEPGEEHVDIAESSGYTTTKQAAKALGVSRRTVQSYVRRGELEAVVEGEGVEKTFYVSIDSLNALREARARRRVSGESAPGFAEGAPGASAGSGVAAKPEKGPDEFAPDLIEVVQDLQYRLGRAEAQAELTARTESTLREQLAREQERADRLEAELREAREAPLTAAEGSGRGGVSPREPPWWRRIFGLPREPPR
jgi:excisionase family DNA binding protein